MSERYIRWVIAQRKWLVIVTLFAVITLAMGTSRLTFTSDFRAYFAPENPQLLAFEAMERTFSKQENVFFFVGARQGDIFNRRGLELIETLTNRGWQLPHSQRVMSLQNYQHTEAQGDELLIDYLYENAMELDDAALQRIRAISFDEPTLLHRLISEDGASTGVTVSTMLPDDLSREASAEVVNAARALADELRPVYPWFDILIGGSLASNVTMGEAIRQDIENLLGLSYLIMIIAMVVLLRTFSGMVLTLMIISFSVMSTIGFFGWLGFTMTPPTGFVPTAILTIAVADTIHILITYYYELSQGRRKNHAIREALRINFSPVLITSVTTIIGVLCLNTSAQGEGGESATNINAGVGRWCDQVP